MVAQLEGQAGVAAHARAPFGHGDAPHLRGAGLARHQHVGNVHARRAAGAASVDHRAHRVADGDQMLLRHAHGRGLRSLGAQQEIGHQLPPGGKPRGHHRHLQRIDEHIALTDGGVDRVVGLPFLVIFPKLPLRVWHGAIALAGEGKVETLAHAHAPRHAGDPLHADALGHLVEIDVAALGDGGAHVDRAMTAPFVAVEQRIAHAQRAAAPHRLRRAYARLQQRQRHHRLDRGAGRIKPLKRLVAEGDMIVLRQHVPFQMADAVGKAVGIETGHGGHGQHVAIAAIDHHHRSALRGEAAAGIFLQARVDGEVDRFAGLIRAGGEFANDLAARRHFHPLGAGLAGQMAVERLFQPVLADLEARRDQQRVAAGLVILRRRRADIAEQMADGRAGGVMAGKALAGRDAGQVGQAHADGGILIIGQLVGDLDRAEAGGFLQLLMDAVNFLALQPQQLGEVADRRVRVRHPLRDEIDAKVGAVVRQRLAVAVQYPAAPGRDQRQVDAIAFRQKLIFLIFRHTDPRHPADQHRAQRALQSAHDHRPPGEGEGLGGFVDGLAGGFGEFHAITRQRSMRAH